MAELDPHAEDVARALHSPEPRARGPLTRFNAALARWCMYAVVAGLLAIVVIVFYQVVGRYALNSSPTWAENCCRSRSVVWLVTWMLGIGMGRTSRWQEALSPG